MTARPSPPEPAADGDPPSLDANRMAIDLAAIEANYREIRRRLGARRKIVASLKADAYGHGAVAVARVLSASGVDYLAVGSLDDARALRRAGIRAPVLLLGGFLPEAARTVVELGLIASVDDEAGALAIARAASAPAPVCVKVDCGFGRFGVELAAAAGLIRFVAGQERLHLEGIYTHLPFSDAAGRAWAEGRTRAFEGLVAALAGEGLRPALTQALASPGLLAGLHDGLSGAAIGHALFGLQPLDAALASPAAPIALAPALRAITTRLLHRGRSEGDAGAAAYLRGRERSVGVVPIGIHHGYRPALGPAFMLVDGARAPVLRVCLENTILDLGAAGGAAPGDEVVVLGASRGERISLGDLADWQRTSPLALAVALGRSIPRCYPRGA